MVDIAGVGIPKGSLLMRHDLPALIFIGQFSHIEQTIQKILRPPQQADLQALPGPFQIAALALQLQPLDR